MKGMLYKVYQEIYIHVYVYDSYNKILIRKSIIFKCN